MWNSRKLSVPLVFGIVMLMALQARAADGVTESAMQDVSAPVTQSAVVDVAVGPVVKAPDAPVVLPPNNTPEDQARDRSIKIAGFSIDGRFDLNYEIRNFENVPKEIWRNQSLVNYHHFLFLSRNKQSEPVFISIEAIDLSFYELGVKLPYRSSVKFGKIWVPFGADPLFHHQYGGLNGFDQKLLPFLWAELGASIKIPVYRNLLKRLSIDSETAIVSGISGKSDKPLALNSNGDPGRLALVDRVRVSWDHFGFWGSVYWDRYAPGKDLVMWGLDAAANYGFLSFAPGLSLKVGAVRADVRATKSLGNYYHFADYLEAKYQLPKNFTLGYRTGAITMDNHKSLYFDRDHKTADDTVTHSFTAYWRYGYLGVSLQYQLNLEAVDEVDNDLIRLTTVLEF